MESLHYWSDWKNYEFSYHSFIYFEMNFICYFKVILHSQVNASLTIYDAWLDLQDGFVHTRQGDGRPTSGFFPLVISSSSKAGILFSICLGKTTAEGIDF